jgi:hypothetical protein
MEHILVWAAGLAPSAMTRVSVAGLVVGAVARRVQAGQVYQGKETPVGRAAHRLRPGPVAAALARSERMRADQVPVQTVATAGQEQPSRSPGQPQRAHMSLAHTPLVVAEVAAVVVLAALVGPVAVAPESEELTQQPALLGQ